MDGTSDGSRQVHECGASVGMNIVNARNCIQQIKMDFEEKFVEKIFKKVSEIT